MGALFLCFGKNAVKLLLRSWIPTTCTKRFGRFRFQSAWPYMGAASPKLDSHLPLHSNAGVSLKQLSSAKDWCGGHREQQHIFIHMTCSFFHS
ncbi:hypothetical protein ABE28_017320 [Peribacillus muralis]|uniref:Uncharacterized protein n=1 Tax=Peribacillus muralis TaxID=264697 RepID=A0A1B3XSD2_9BACI|nr:hypothetical protein ABE28_017320 [Peribacillus muralis]